MVWIDDETAQIFYGTKASRTHLEAKYSVYKSTHVHKTAQHTCLQHFIRSVPRLETVHYTSKQSLLKPQPRPILLSNPTNRILF